MEGERRNINGNSDQSDAENRILEGLKSIRLEERVAHAAQERTSRMRMRKRLGLMAVAILTASVLTIWYMNAPEKTESIPPVSTPPIQPPGQNQIKNPAPSQPTEGPQQEKAKPQKKYTGPIAQSRPEPGLADPSYGAPRPQFRGEDDKTDEERWELLDQVWYTNYPVTGLVIDSSLIEADKLLKKRAFNEAYIVLHRLQRSSPSNQKIRFLKGYCLLETGQTLESIPFFATTQNLSTQVQQRAEWYTALAFLHAGEMEQAQQALRAISNQKKHPFYRQAQKALALFQ
ncbi:MAG: hypothetical protein R2792_04910 [Saprospiraceae bacterium]